MQSTLILTFGIFHKAKRGQNFEISNLLSDILFVSLHSHSLNQVDPILQLMFVCESGRQILVDNLLSVKNYRASIIENVFRGLIHVAYNLDDQVRIASLELQF